MRYFVTGATGFIGGRLAQRLRADGHEVVALVRDVSKAADLEALGVELAQGDITQPGTLRAPMMGADGVFHLAAWYQVGGDSSRAEAINVGGTRNVLETAEALEIPKVVYTSTLAINSHTEGRRMDESYRFSGQHVSAYDETKARAHWDVAVPVQERGVPLVIVMPGVVYGPGDTSQMGDLLGDAAAGKMVTIPPGGACWAHVDDIVDGHVRAMGQGEVGESYIIAGPCHTFREGFEAAATAGGHTLRGVVIPTGLLKGLSKVASVVEKVISLPPMYSAEAMRATAGTTYYGDNAKAKRELGYAPRGLTEGMRDTFGA